MEKILNIKGVDYIVSSDGKVFSTKNIVRGKYHKEITQRKNQDGYMVVTVGAKDNRVSKRVHRIIATAFIPNPDNLPEVDHIDNNKENNNYLNLRWISGFENKSRIPFETRSKSHKWEANGRAKLSINDVLKIRKLYSEGKTQNEIAKIYKRGWSTIHNIIIGNTWKGVENTL